MSALDKQGICRPVGGTGAVKIFDLMIGIGAIVLSGYALAGYEAGVTAYRNGDYEAAFQEFEPLAEDGEARAQRYLGLMYELGDFVPQNSKKAAKWYRLAADQGDANSQYALGSMYFSGQGVPMDYEEALKWDLLAAEGGVADAQFVVGAAYDGGHVFEQDFVQAAKWYRRSAEQGYHWAQFALAQLYSEGEGVPRDLVQAYAWYAVAAANGSTDAEKPRKVASKMMTPSQLEKAKSLAREYFDRYQFGASQSG